MLSTSIGYIYLLQPRHSMKPSAIKHLTFERRSNDLKIQFEKINDPWLMSLAGAAFQSKCWKSTTLWSIKGKWFAITKGHKNGFNSWCKARTKPLRHKQCHEPSGSQPANQESNSITPTHNSGNALGNYVSGARRTLFFLCYFLFISYLHHFSSFAFIRFWTWRVAHSKFGVAHNISSFHHISWSAGFINIISSNISARSLGLDACCVLSTCFPTSVLLLIFVHF